MLNPVRTIASLPRAVARTTASTLATAASTAEAVAGTGLEQARKVLVTRDRPRQLWSAPGRAHIELRPVDPEKFGVFAAKLRDRLGSQPGVQWVEALGTIGRVVVGFDEGATSSEELIDTVEAVEEDVGADGNPFPLERPDHPGDVAPVLRGVAELSGDALGVMLSLVGRFTPVRALPVPFNPGMITSLLTYTPRLRQPIEQHLGTTATDVVLALANGVSQGLSGSLLGPVLDMAQQSVLLNEAIARRSLWHELEPRLWAEPSGHEPLPAMTGERPRPIPPGPLERYAETMWRTSLIAFATTLPATRSLQRATAALYAGVPKAGRIGREVFAAQVGRVFVGQGVLTRDPRVLRLLDRVDCLVVHEDLLVERSFELGEASVLSGPGAQTSTEEVRRRAWSLFDANRPDRVRRNDGWTLGPLDALGLEPPRGQRRAAGRLRRNGRTALGLAHKGHLVAMVAVQPSLRPGAEELVAAARRAGLEVAIAGGRHGATQLEARRLPASGPALTRAIRRLQREGRVVGLVASGDAPALLAADLSLGLRLPGDPPALSAHLLADDDDLVHAFLLVQACEAGRQASRQSVRLALAGASVGGVLTLTGLPAGATRRVVTTINVASTLSLGNGIRLATDLALRPPPLVRDRTPWHAMEVHEVLKRLGSSTRGLDDEEAERRRQAPERPPSGPELLARSVLREVVTPLTPILGAGAGLSAAFGSLTDAVMVSSVVGFNALIGGVQQFRADRAIAQLGGRHKGTVLVRRGGKEREIDPDELVPGDVVRLRAGDLVPADCRILDAVALEVDESSLTGESLPVTKTPDPSLSMTVAERSSMLYEGTSIAAGQATAVVVATGPRTEARMGALLAATPAAPSGVEARLSGLTSLSSPVALGSALGVAGLGALRGVSLRDVAGASVSLAVAAVPEGLPLLATMAQLSAARRLSGLGALVRAPRAVEALGRVDVVCADKTGTLTEGHIRLRRVADGLGEERVEELSQLGRQVVAAGLRASPNDPPDKVPHPTDRALLRAGRDLGESELNGAPGWSRIAELPFEPSRGFHAVLGRSGGGLLLSVKGAPEEILPRCTRRRRADVVYPLDDRGRAELDAEASRLARQGLRLLAVAESTEVAEPSLDDAAVRDLTFLGFLGFSDPVRPAATRAVADLERAGIEVVMITGDHPSTAEGIAIDLELPTSRIVTGAEMDRLSDSELEAVLPGASVFARVTPTHKVRIVAALQRMGRVVAMTGDGANDAPAIRLADVGIALGARSTEAARDAAALVVVDDRIETIVAAVLEGRALWASVREAVAILVGGNLGEIAFTLAGTALSGRSPLNARQLLLVNLLTDAVPSVAIATRPPTKRSPEDLLREGPDASLGPALNRAIAWRAGTTAAGASAAWLAARMTGTRGRAGTVALVALVGTQLGQTLVVGWRDPVVVAAALGSAAALAIMVQLPGVSQLFGSRPLGPLGWTLALTSAGLATTGSVVLPHFLGRETAGPDGDHGR
jgi:cation-transporting ATPase I